jgi:hypothetical protein
LPGGQVFDRVDPIDGLRQLPGQIVPTLGQFAVAVGFALLE